MHPTFVAAAVLKFKSVIAPVAEIQEFFFWPLVDDLLPPHCPLPKRKNATAKSVVKKDDLASFLFCLSFATEH